MNEDQMNEMLIQGVRDYNAPRGDVPREEMWRRIQEARAEAKRTTTPAVVPMDRARRRWLVPSIGVAAAGLVAVGIAIGRYLDRAAPVAAPTVAAVSTPARSDSTTAKPQADSTAEQVRRLHDATRKTDERVRALASAEQVEPAREAVANAGGSSPASGTNGVAAAPAGAPTNQSLAYRLVVLQHLAGSEAMITSFRSEARNDRLDAELASWSRELLSTTRLLESSQASTDPVMKRLLDDLDLVISQIVQYTDKGKMNTEELDLIEQSINKRGVMAKLRSTTSRTFPAGS
jgi:hypothetical protein